MKAPEEAERNSKIDSQPDHRIGWLAAFVAVSVIGVLSMFLWFNLNKGTPAKEKPSEKEEAAKSDVVDLGKSESRIEVASVTRVSPAAKFSVTGTVEPNQQQLQQITPLVSGRVKNISVSLGDYVSRGTLLITIDSPAVAELHGKLHEAETRLRLAKTTLHRVKQSANRVLILKAAATLAESESNLARTQKLVSEGLTARKDLISAEAEHERAKAEYNFQKDISLNREVSEAKAQLSTAETETEHIRDGLRALDARLPREGEKTDHDISTIELRSPIPGTVIERLVNPGSGFDQGKPLLTIANTATLWVIANVPEKQMSFIKVGTPARVLLSGEAITGKVSYIDPRLNEDTRTARVRVEIKNSKQKIQVGSFAQIEFTKTANIQTAELFVSKAAVHSVNGKAVVFVRSDSGEYTVRKVEVGDAVADLVPVFNGLSAGENVAAKGSFVLKSKLLKDTFGEDD